MKVKFDVSEIYPAYLPIRGGLTRFERGKPVVSISETTFKKWLKVCREYEKLQDRIYKLVDGNTN